MAGAVRHRLILGGVVLAALVGAWLGARHLAFQCDDAFISYRYVDHLVRGWGLVWNPAPFAPVEGYTSLSWVLLLGAIWSLAGLEPPQVATGLELVFAAGSLGVVAWLTTRLGASERQEPWLLALILGGTAASPVWLTWSTGGMGTSLFTLLLLGWVAAVLGSSRIVLHCSLATAAALTRPEGMLLVLASIALGLWRERGRPKGLTGLTPLLVVVAHLGWRWWTYGAWVPNTFTSRQAGWWPQAGVAHLGAFLVEGGGWVVLVLGAVWLWRKGRGGRPTPDQLAVVGVVAGHALAYALVLGGDHFGHRAQVHLVPLLLLAAAWLALRLSARWSLGLLALVPLLGLPIPWGREVVASASQGRHDSYQLSTALGPHLPPGLSQAVAPLDALRTWMGQHHVGTHRQEHVDFIRYQRQRVPGREVGEAIPWEHGHPVLVESTVGWPGWTLPQVAIIDSLGLNDRVVARTERPTHMPRRLAHDRSPPPGYLQCFEPNVGFKAGQVDIRPRELPDERIVECETREWPLEAPPPPPPGVRR